MSANPLRSVHPPVKKLRCDRADRRRAILPLDPARAALPLDEPAPPLLRGWFHLVAFVVSVPAGILVVAGATSIKARVAAIVYAMAVSVLFAVSSTYHRRVWTSDGRRRMRRLDHGTVFVMIGGCYTPLCLLALSGPVSGALLVGAWVGAAIGLGLAITGLAEKRCFRPGVLHQPGVELRRCCASARPPAQRGRPGPARHWRTGLYGGALVLGTDWPNPYPAIFGYHEVWHAPVIVACVCHYIAIYSMVHGAP
jgi:hemolysin III